MASSEVKRVLGQLTIQLFTVLAIQILTYCLEFCSMVQVTLASILDFASSHACMLKKLEVHIKIIFVLNTLNN